MLPAGRRRLQEVKLTGKDKSQRLPDLEFHKVFISRSISKDRLQEFLLLFHM